MKDVPLLREKEDTTSLSVAKGRGDSYQRAYAEELQNRKVGFEREKSIAIYSPRKSIVGSYQPNFVIDERIVVEVKALETMPKKMLDQLFDYLRNSKYELGYLVNFASPRLYLKRVIYTNDRKGFIHGL